jgi:hypothetical protein
VNPVADKTKPITPEERAAGVIGRNAGGGRVIAIGAKFQANRGGQGGGRKRKFPPNVAQLVISALVAFLVEKRTATGRLPMRKSETVVSKARELAADEGVLAAGDRILREQIIGPAFKSVEAKYPKTVSGKKP